MAAVAQSILDGLWARGIMLRLIPGGALEASGNSSRLTDADRQAIRAHKAELIATLNQTQAKKPTDEHHPADTAPAPCQTPTKPKRRNPAIPAPLGGSGPCYCCKSTRFWVSIYGKVTCPRCHPPASPELVKGWLEVEPI